MKKFALASAATFALLVSSAAMTSAHAQDEAFRIAYVEGMSGPFANVGDQGLKHFTHAIEKINAATVEWVDRHPGAYRVPAIPPSTRKMLGTSEDYARTAAAIAPVVAEAVWAAKE